MPDNSDLLNFVTSVSGDAYLKVEENLGDGFVRLKTSEAERRQAKHDIRGIEDIVVELLKKCPRCPRTTHLPGDRPRGRSQARSPCSTMVSACPIRSRAAIFEPRVTSKLETMVMDKWGVHGRGMALFSIKTNTLEAAVDGIGRPQGHRNLGPGRRAGPSRANRPIDVADGRAG